MDIKFSLYILSSLVERFINFSFNCSWALTILLWLQLGYIIRDKLHVTGFYYWETGVSILYIFASVWFLNDSSDPNSADSADGTLLPTLVFFLFLVWIFRSWLLRSFNLSGFPVTLPLRVSQLQLASTTYIQLKQFISKR